jgi:hypothetical protein
MEWTNNLNLPAPLASAVQADQYDRVGDISVTSLILPPRIRQLEIRHSDEIVEDVSEGIWRLIGSVGHKILERADTTNHLAEERLTARVAGWMISGKADLLGPDMTLDDYKFRSVWAMLNAKVEDEQQLNSYAWLYRKNGFEVRRARIVAPLRDWSKLRAEREPGYPQAGVIVREIPLWTPQQQEDFVISRVINHQIAEGIPDDELPPCTPEERWHKPDTWAVKKKGNKRAHRVYNTLPEAENNQPGGYEIEHRPGVDTRCASYCRVAQFCAFGRAIRGTQPTVIEEEAAA